MPLSEHSKKNLIILAAGLIAIVVGFFFLYAFLLNRGKLTIIASAPYVFQIDNFKTVPCSNAECSVDLAPGNYTITVKKENYREAIINLTVPIGGHLRQQVELKFIPQFTLKNLSSPRDSFCETAIPEKFRTKSGATSNLDFVAYLETDASSTRQTLYLEPLDADSGTKTVITSFLRTITSPLLKISPDSSKITIVDSTAAGSTLYLIDLKKSSRKALFSYQRISAIKWLPSSLSFLFQARPKNALNESIFLYQLASGKVVQLDLITSLGAVQILDDNRLIAGTLQKVIPQISTGDDSLVLLGDLQATPMIKTAPELSFIDYTLEPRQGRLLLSVPELSMPVKACLIDSQKAIDYLISEKIYELVFDE